MALTSCPECRGQISDAAPLCPHCGHPLLHVDPKQPTSPGWYLDPSGIATNEAYWDGEKWTGATRQPELPHDTIESQRARGWLIASGALLIVGSFLPWAQAGLFSFAGTRGDGVLTLIAGLIIGIIGFFRPTTAAPGIGTLVLSGFSLFIVWNVFSRLSDTPENMGTGILVAGVGAVIGLFAGLRSLDDWRVNRSALL